jgi:polyferredoxin
MLKKLNKLLENKWFPVSFRILAIIAFIGLVIIGFSSPTNDPFFVSQLSKTNLTTSFVWRLWWPMIVLSAIFLGRVWCMMCPVETVTTFFAKIGLKRKRPKWILSGWVITLFYMLVLTVGITILGIDLNPKYTSYYLLIIMGISILSGLVFEKNTFCRYICPVGYMLGIFSKMAAWGWRVKKESVCGSCSDKSCINDKYTYQLNYKSCGVDLVPANINNNNHCLLCAGCLKTCKTYKSSNNSLRPNPAIVKIGFANDLMQIQPLRLAEWFFLFFLTGSMIFEMTHFQVISNISASLISDNVSNYLSLNEGIWQDLISVIYLFFFIPVVLWILPYLLILSFRIRISLNDYLKNISILFLPVIAGFFVGLVVMEIATKFPFYKYIAHDVKGVETIKSILFRQIEMPQLPYWTEWVFILILISALLIGISFSLKLIRKLADKFDLQKTIKLLYILPIIFIFVIFAGALAYRFF